MEKDDMFELLFRSATNRELREEEILNIFGVTSLNEIPTDKLIKYCNKYYCTKEGL